MSVLSVLKSRPALFFRLSGICLADFDALVHQLQPLWLAQEKQRLTRKDRQRAIGGGRKYRLELSEQLLLCLIYYRTYASQAFIGLVFNISSPTVSRRVCAMTILMAGHFAMPERKIKLSTKDQNELLYLMIDGTERPVQRPSPAPQNTLKAQSQVLGKEEAPYSVAPDHYRRQKTDPGRWFCTAWAQARQADL